MIQKGMKPKKKGSVGRVKIKRNYEAKGRRAYVKGLFWVRTGSPRLLSWSERPSG